MNLNVNPLMMLSNLISDLNEHLKTFGDMPCMFNRTVYTQVDSHTRNASIFVSTDHDNYKDPVDFTLYIEGE